MTHTTLSVEGIDVLIEGDGPQTLLMLHGWPDTHRLWDATVDALKARHRCVRLTLPGFDPALAPRGTTLAQMTATLQRVVDAVSPDAPVTLVLHDWGCIFGYEYAMQHPRRVARIVGVDIGDHNSGAFLRSLGGKQKFQIFAYQFWLAIAWKLGGWWPALANRMTRWMARAMRCRTDPAGISWQMNYPYAMQWFRSLGGLGAARRVALDCPMLYVYGERKPFMFHSGKWLERLATQPGCKAQAFSTGHWVMVQQPQAFNDCVANWLDGKG
ncbi:MAG: alpha/beta fold hydrolase [Ramlibacter sp.]|nr:alpha/beta fold hydrolase [Ramlibacter sp.]